MNEPLHPDDEALVKSLVPRKPAFKKIAMPRGWDPSQKLVDKLAGMNRSARRAWMARLENRKGWK